MTDHFDIGSVRVAVSFKARIVGLIGRRYVVGVPLLFPKCSSIHTFFMRIPVDIVCLDRQNRVVRIHHNVPPFRVLFGGIRTRHVLELPSGYCRRHDLVVGDTVVYEELERA